MCSIFGSYSKTKFIEFANLNQFRGQHSHSICVFDPSEGVKKIIKEKGIFNTNNIPEKENNQYYIGHVQAPTNGLTEEINNRIHPSIIENEKTKTYLWHNGIIKPDQCEKIKNIININENWDTKLLHHSINVSGLRVINEIDGSFGCIYIEDNGVYIFTSITIRLFYDDYMNLSSVNFEKSKKLKSNKIFKINFKNNKFDFKLNFDSVSNPYYFGGNT